MRLRRVVGCTLLLGGVLLTRATAAENPTPLTGYRISSWTEEDGVPAGAIWALAQDKDGFLWIGSDSGLVRFDGARFRTWPELGGAALPGRSVRALTIGDDGSIWVAFGDQPTIARLQGRELTTYGPKEGLADTHTNALIRDAAGTLWAGTSKGVLQFSGTTWKPASDGAIGARIVALAAARSGDLYAATENAVFQRAAGSAQFRQIGSSRTVIQSIAIDSSNRLWMTDRNAGYRLMNSASKDGGAQRGKGYRLLPDSKGNLWIATYGQGIWRVRLGSASATPAPVQSVTDFQGLSNNVVPALLEDRNGNIWAGTTSGLNRLAPQRLTQVTDLGVVTGLEVTSPDTLWANTSGGLARFELRGGEWRKSEPNVLGLRAEIIDADTDGALWVANTSGVERIRISGGSLRRQRISSDLRRVKAIAPAPDGTVWLFDVDRGLLRWSRGSLQEAPLPEAVRGHRILSMFADRSNRLWIALLEQSPLVAMEGTTTHLYGAADGFSAGVIRMFFEDREGVLWIAGSLGLSRFANGHFVTLKRDQHLPIDAVTSVVEDDRGILWIGTASGLLRIDKRQVDAALAGRSDDVSVTTFGATDGVAGTTGWIGQRSAVRSSDGRLWFLTVTGMTVVDPRLVQDTAPPVPVRVDVVSIDDRRVPISPAMEIAPDASRLQIEFTVPNVSPAQQTRFRYRLDGFDTAWIDSGRLRTAIYTNLPPRSYRFQVQQQEPTGSWGQSALWGFSVQSAFYETPWFIGAVATLALALGWSAWRFRVAQVRRQLTIVHSERARLSREIHDTLLQSLVGLALQCGALANAPNHLSASRGILDLRRQIEGYVRECRQSLWNLRSPMLEEHDLASSLRQVAERATNAAGITLDMTVGGMPRRLPGRIDDQLLRVGQEAVTNAVRHSRADRVRVRLDYGDSRVTLTVQDAGIGFNPHDPMHAERGHWGLIGMQERGKAVNGQVCITSTAGHGTEVVLIVPLPRTDTRDGQTPDHRAVHRRSSDSARRHRADHQPAT